MTSNIHIHTGLYKRVLAGACEQRSTEKTAVVTSTGLYEFKRMLFELHGALATFQRLVNKVLRGCQSFAEAYLDDIVIFSATWEEHLLHLEQVLTCLSGAGQTAKQEKCKLGAQQVVYVGYVVGGCEIRLIKDKVRAIKDSTKPFTKKDVRSFLGLTGY